MLLPMQQTWMRVASAWLVSSPALTVTLAAWVSVTAASNNDSSRSVCLMSFIVVSCRFSEDKDKHLFWKTMLLHWKNNVSTLKKQRFVLKKPSVPFFARVRAHVPYIIISGAKWYTIGVKTIYSIRLQASLLCKIDLKARSETLKKTKSWPMCPKVPK